MTGRTLPAPPARAAATATPMDPGRRPRRALRRKDDARWAEALLLALRLLLPGASWGPVIRASERRPASGKARKSNARRRLHLWPLSGKPCLQLAQQLFAMTPGRRDVRAARAFLASDAWENKVSDNPSADTGAGGSAFQAAKDAVASAAEQVRASAPGAYDASAKAARYVGEATADHPLPVLLVTAVLAFLAGYASHTRGEGDRWAGKVRRLIGRSEVPN